MKNTTLSLMRSLIFMFPLIGWLLGLSTSITVSIWMAGIVCVIALTLVSWHKEGRSFKPLAPLTLAIIGALTIVYLWFALFP